MRLWHANASPIFWHDMKLPFTKMHGAGNDFVVINQLVQDYHLTPQQLRKLADRRFGVGADQVLLLLPSDRYDFRMQIYNADGGEVEMCGNGIRCVAKFLADQGIAGKEQVAIETQAGLIQPTVIKDHERNTADTLWVRVDMGEPVLEGAAIPTAGTGRLVNQKLFPALEAHPESLYFTAVSMGNPHAVLFTTQLAQSPVTMLGPLIEHHAFFPKRTNVEFVEVVDGTHLKMRVWERGAGETWACGTGACAALVAAVLNDRAEPKAEIELKGGVLEIEWDRRTNHVWMTGPATTVYEGTIYV